jgi:hypothetical protein
MTSGISLRQNQRRPCKTPISQFRYARSFAPGSRRRDRPRDSFISAENRLTPPDHFHIR